MAEYTVELRKIVESGIPIFDFPYPFYDETKRKEFEEKFIKHFYFREIGCETVDRFKWFLADKMNVVFPFYNELFKTALIEYDKLYNYDMSETYTRNIESNQKGGGVSSTVGRFTGEQDTESKQNKTVDTVGTSDTIGSDTEKETGTSETNTEGTSNTTTSETANGNASKSSNSDVRKKFLDTPQGLTDLTDSKYLTSLNQDTATATETGNDSRTTNGSNDNETTGKSSTESERNNSRNSSIEQDTTGKETTADNIASSVRDEQKTTQDNNTRSYNQGEQKESYTLTRKGNIGVQTGSDMIEKHIDLQKKLSKIEAMFFAECEDLFMLVW